MSEDSTTLTEHVVLVSRGSDGKFGMGMHKVASTIFAHELPILKSLHGAENVEVAETSEVIFDGFDVTDEYLRLRRKYNRGDHRDLVEKIYGHDAAILASRLGIRRFKDADDIGVIQPVQVDFRPKDAPKRRSAPGLLRGTA